MRYNIGMKVFGDWEIVAELGEGSFGKVFRLEKNTYKVKASSALKVLTVPRSPAEVEDAILEGYDERSVTEQFHEVVEKLVDEIAVMAELKSHPNIVSVEDYTVIEHQGTIGWDILIRMELLTPLQVHQRRNPMDEAAICELAKGICEALVFCQSKKLIHRDIKPGNVFVDSMGRFKLGDFGVARTAEKTVSNMSKQGTENYMAPEVYYGKEYGPNVDIYSLGMMLYRLMNKNRLPFYPLPPAFPRFSEKESALLRRMQGEALPAPCDASDAFAEIILKACEADPKKRYRTASEMLTDLQRKTGQDSVVDTTKEEDSLEMFLAGKELTQELLTEIMTTRKLTPAEMVYLMSRLESSREEKDEISFDQEEKEYEKDKFSFEQSSDEDVLEEDTWEETAGTIGAFATRANTKNVAGKQKEKSKEIKKEKESFVRNSGLEQYLLINTEEDMTGEKENSAQNFERWADWREDSTDEMRDHTIHQPLHTDEDEDATISVFGGKTNVRKDTTAKKSVDKRSTDKKPMNKKPADRELADKKSLDKFVLKDDAEGRSLAELNLTVRTYNVLTRAGIKTVEELCAQTLEDVKSVNNLGPKAVEELLTALMAQGLRLRTGKSMIQQRQEEKRQWTLEYWKKKLPDLFEANAKNIHGSFIAKEKGTWIYFAPDIPANVCADAIHNITENHITRFGVSMTVSDKNTKWVKKDDVLGILDVSIEKDFCKRGIVVTGEALYLRLGNTAKNSPENIVIPYKEFENGRVEVTSSLLKGKRTVLCWNTTTSVGVQRYESGISAMLDYNMLLQCLREVSRVHRERF